jgi:hypothetical protein
MLAPNDDPPGFRYTLYLDLSPTPTGLQLTALAVDLDARLGQNFHYDYCRRLGQLAPVDLCLIKDGLNSYIRAGQARGQRLGDIKPTSLQKTAGWTARFQSIKSHQSET